MVLTNKFSRLCQAWALLFLAGCSAIEGRENGREFLVTDYGACGDGVTLNTIAFGDAIAAAEKAGGGCVVVPKGVFLSGAIFFRPNTRLRLADGAVLKGSEDERDYPARMTRIEGEERVYCPALVNADGVDGFSVVGPGVLDGSGYVFWRRLIDRARRIPGTENTDVPRPRLLYVSNSRHVLVRDVTLKNAAFWTTHFYKCEDVEIDGVRIYTEVIDGVAGENPDAVDLDAVRRVRIHDAFMDVPNDAITLKGGKGPTAHDFRLSPESGPVEDVLVENCSFGEQCTGCLTFGSECVVGRNVTIRNCSVARAKAVLRLKMRPDTRQVYRDVLVEGISGVAGHALVIAPYVAHAHAEWKDLHLRSEVSDVTVRVGALVCRDGISRIEPSCDYSLERVECR